MEVCKNKISNRYFIFIEDTGNAETLLVTPEAQIKSLKGDLFEELEDQEENYLLQHNLVTEAQVQRVHEYYKSRSDEIIDNFEEMSHYDQKRLLQALQKMVADK
jgi:Mg/Co/Ni transporter MgtE